MSDRETNREAEVSMHNYPMENQRTGVQKHQLREAFGSNTSPTKLDLLPKKQSSYDKAANTDEECEEEGEVIKTKVTYAKSTQDQEHDMTKKVVVYLEKMRERNSSLQERLNLSFKKSSRVKKSAITSRPTTVIKRNTGLNISDFGDSQDYLSLSRQGNGSGTNYGLSRQLVSKTPNIVNFASFKNHKNSDDASHEEHDTNRIRQWGGMKP